MQVIIYTPVNAEEQTATITVTGIIKDSKTNETIPMAHVIAVTSDGNTINKDGGVLGTTSNITDGKFELSNVPSDAQIKISFVGYETQIVKADENLDIKLVESKETLDEVAVVAEKIKEGDSCEKPEEKIKKGQYKEIDGRYVCVPTECEDGLIVNDGKCSQEELQKDNKDSDEKMNTNSPSDEESKPDEDNDNDDKDSDKAVKEAQEKYDKAKEKEQSLANRTLGAVTMAATGIGGMELAQGLSEQRIDRESEQDMAAYIETFRCEYANGKSVKNGATNVELPADTLFDLYQEYIALAADLKERKEQLGLAPGIESEVIIDKATAGLYDDKASEKANGTYASIYRAKMGNETDQSKLQEMSDTSGKRVKGGAIAAGAGALVGIVGNSLINGKLGDKIKEAKEKKNSEKTEKVALEKLQKCLSDGGAKNSKQLKFSKFTPSVLTLDKINCSDSAWKSKVRNKNASDLFIDSTDEIAISEKLVKSFGEDIARKLMGGIVMGRAGQTPEQSSKSNEIQANNKNCSVGTYDIEFEQCVNPTTNGTAMGFISHDGQSKDGDTTYGLTENGTWAVEFDYGIMKGIESCNGTSGDNADYTWSNDSSNWLRPGNTFTQDSEGQYCWCKMTSPSASGWVFYRDYDLADRCANNCAYRCAFGVRFNSDFRSAVVSAVGN